MLLMVAPIVFGILIGLLLGLVGGGGSILTVPILVYVIGLTPHEATATSLVIVGATALAGVLPHTLEHRVQWRTAVIFGLAGIAGTFGGAWANRRVSGPMILFLFGVLMLIVAARMVLRKAPKAADAPEPKLWVIPVAGLSVGLLTGFFGDGGGFVIVPALVLWLGLPMRIAIGTSLVVIAINSVSGALAHWSDGGFNWPVALLFLAGGLVGGQVGARSVGRVDEEHLRRGFAGLVVAVALFLIAKNALVLWQGVASQVL
jgi:uncharacterized membrane protein YfcA